MNTVSPNPVDDIAQQFGIDWWKFSMQMLCLVAVLAVVFAPPIFVSRFCVRYHRTDSRLPVWLLFVWLVPIFGPIFTFLALRRERLN
jgi:hypothetical protein